MPGRVGVIGWDGGDLVAALGLTSVHQPLADSGRIGAELLLDLIHRGGATEDARRIALLPHLVARRTA